MNNDKIKMRVEIVLHECINRDVLNNNMIKISADDIIADIEFVINKKKKEKRNENT